MEAMNLRNSGSQRKSNMRTALVLLTVVLVFFAGIISAQVLGGPIAAVTIMGAMVLIFLLVAIGRNLRR